MNFAVVFITIVFALALGAVFSLFWVERKARMACEQNLFATLLNLQALKKAAGAVVQNAIKANEPEHVEAKIEPFVIAAKELGGTGHQKRMQVLLAFLKEHPGTSVATAEIAIEKVLQRG